MCCLRCCINCFERFIRFINKHAFIEVALEGKDFCSSAQAAFSLILKNPIKTALITGLGNVIVNIGELFICILAGGATFCFMYTGAY